MSVRVDAPVRRHSWIAFAPQLTLDGSLGDPPRSEEQARRLEHDLATLARPRCHDGDPLTGGGTCVAAKGRPGQPWRRKSLTSGSCSKPAEAYVATAATFLLGVHTVALDAPISRSAAAAATEMAVPYPWPR